MPSSEERVQALRPATGIVVTYRGSTEESTDDRVETQEEEYVCRRDGQCRRIRMVWTKTFRPFRSRSSVLSDEPITETEYSQATQGCEVEDTPALFEDMKRKGEMWKELEDMRPFCTKCKKRMAYKHNSKDKIHFWGCSSYPKCKGTREITAAQQVKIAEAEKLGIPLHR